MGPIDGAELLGGLVSIGEVRCTLKAGIFWHFFSNEEIVMDHVEGRYRIQRHVKRCHGICALQMAVTMENRYSELWD